MGIVDNALIGASGQGGYFLTRSLRTRSSASASLTRTPASSSSQNRWTWSGWVKRGRLGVTQTIFSAYSAASYQTYINFTSSDTLQFNNFWGSDNENIITTQVFRDPSAWYHLVFAINLSASTYQNAVQMFVNGVQITAFSTTTFTNSFNAGAVNGNYPHSIGSYATQSSNYTDLYLAEVNFVDGQQLLPSSFGSTNTLTGVWQPARYGGTYGTNGFYLPFTDNSALTTSSNVGLGKDFSGNGNYWTTNNISITAGTTYDSMTDVPTLTSATAANFAVLNPLNAAATLNDGNMNARVTGTGGNYSVSSTIALSSGLIYFETTPYVFSLVNGQIGEFGICYATANLQAVGTRITNSGVGVGFGFGQGSSTWFSRNFGTATNLTGLSGFTTTTVAMVAVNLTTGNIWVGKDGVWYNSGNPATGANPTITGIPTAQYAIGITAYQDAGLAVFQAVNFGQRPFAYTPPTGFVALNTYNLPTSTIVKGNTVMDATLYTGNASTNTITNAAGFRPDFVWYKARALAYSHQLFDSVRGVTKRLVSNSTAAENTQANYLTSFNSNGFTIGNDAEGNTNASSYVAWQWQAGQGTTSSNTNGTITSTVSVNASAGFSVVTYTGTGANATVGHGLGVAPSLIICKSRGAATNWGVWHASLTSYSYFLLLNSTAAQATAANSLQALPTSTLVSLGASSIFNDASTMVMYCFAPIAGYSAFGSYTGNGSADGPFIYTGFRPKYLMLKRTDSGNSWVIEDSARNTFNVVNNYLIAEGSAAEATSSQVNIDFLSNGFKLRSGFDIVNAGSYIYIAFAENPFKNALAR